MLAISEFLSPFLHSGFRSTSGGSKTPPCPEKVPKPYNRFLLFFSPPPELRSFPHMIQSPTPSLKHRSNPARLLGKRLFFPPAKEPPPPPASFPVQCRSPPFDLGRPPGMLVVDFPLHFFLPFFLSSPRRSFSLPFSGRHSSPLTSLIFFPLLLTWIPVLFPDSPWIISRPGVVAPIKPFLNLNPS